jgi:hypothetical protein
VAQRIIEHFALLKCLAIGEISVISTARRQFVGGGHRLARPFPVFIDERLFEVTPTAHRHRLPPIRDEAGILPT